MNKEKMEYEDKDMMKLKGSLSTRRVSESIIQSCKEVKLMREGKMEKPSLGRLMEDIESWSSEERE